MDQSMLSSSAPAASDMFMFLDQQGNTKGPIAAAVLVKMLRKGVGITAGSLVWHAGMTDWLPASEVEPLKSEVELQQISWYYVDSESGEQKGPVPSRLLLHYMEEGKIDGLTLVFHQKINKWVQLGEISELKKVMQELAEEEERRNSYLASVAVESQIFEDAADSGIPPEVLLEARLAMPTRTTSGGKRSFTSDDGKHFIWDDEENDWVEDENPSGSDGSDEEEDGYSSRQSKVNKANPVANANDKDSGLAEETEDGESSLTEEQKATRKRKRKNKKKASSWNDNASGLWIYVTGLPSDVTMDELKAHFSKVGLIAISPVDQQPKIKIYRNPDQSIKGDCSICYNSPESVQMALELFDGGYLRLNTKISVTKAQFQKRDEDGENNKNNNSSGNKRSRPNVSHAQVKVAQSVMAQALAWNEDDDLGVSKRKALKIVVLEGMFTVEDVQIEGFMEELEQDIVLECEKCGEIEKITVFSKNPRGIVIVKFAKAFAAQECVRVLDGRFFGGQKIKAYFWDGSTDYSAMVSEAAIAAAEQEEETRLNEFGDWLEKEQEELPDELKLRVER